MTRINIVPPSELYDQHLMAEYREIFMVPAALKRSIASKKVYGIPKKYCLGTGHVKFFYDKGLYLFKRYNLLIEELLHRGYNLDPTRKFPIEAFPKQFYNDWCPTEVDLKLIRSRINEKVNLKPEWYRKTTFINK